MKSTSHKEPEMLNTTDTNKLRVARCIARQIDAGMPLEDAIFDTQQHLAISREAVIECIRFGKDYIADLDPHLTRYALPATVENRNLSVAW
jgi:hypothetical protein